MPIHFYPFEEDLKKDVNITLDQKIEILRQAAERYKAVVADPAHVQKQVSVPADLKISYNWDGLAAVLREVRQMSEGTANEKRLKEERILKLAEVYEVLCGAKMQKLEAVRLALVNEAHHLRGAT